MKFAKPFKQLSALIFASAAGCPAVYAHPGHIAEESVHGLLHVEHIIALLAVGAVAYTVYALRKK
ncbi:MAG: hypothetical protein JSW45_12605 [Thiotrichales bacterium]|nr:MAG: hypothetical protein JSW45_12605 [Thiotrichales bacterium]